MTVPVISALLLAGLLATGAVAVVILMDHHDNGCRDFAVLGLFCAALMLLSYYLELNTPDLGARLMALKFGYVGRVFVNPMLLMMVVRYYDLKIRKYIQGLLYVIPIITLCLVFTCDTNPLYYRSVTVRPDGVLVIEPGIFYLVYMGYSTVLALTYLMVCLSQRAALNRKEKRTNTWLILACLVPFFTLIIYLAGWTQGIDTSSLGVMAGSMFVAFAIFRYDLLDKDEMLQSMATGLIFLDSDYRLVYANRAAKHIIPSLAKQTRANRQDLSILCSDDFAAIQVGTATYQRRMDDWSNGEGQHGKLITFDDITEIRARLNRDAMTGLLNHATFYPMLDDAMTNASEQSTRVAVSIADIDSFKRINDTYGHANGDIILMALADTLEDICGVCGDVFRYGGEEFAVIFGKSSAEAEQIMQKALDRFSALSFDFMEEHVTFSYGTAEYDGSESSVTLFDRADQIMYTRKRALHERERAEAEAMRTAVPADSRT